MKSSIKVAAVLALGAFAFASVPADAATLKISAADAARLAITMPRSQHSAEATYFVLTDRYANGSIDNDEGGLNASGGFSPTSMGMYHGGDFVGMTANLDRIKQMGFNAIWVTPPFLNRTTQGGSAAYHGYWGIDFTTVDPHLGTEAEFKTFVDTAHSMGIKVIMDIVVNHTADVISYGSNDYNFVESQTAPYKNAKGKVVDITKLAGLPLCKVGQTTACFPDLKMNAFVNAPFISNGSPRKSPNWLNDVTLYHNRGDANSCGWVAGECSQMGDFYGLDDVMTEDPRVVDGWAATYGAWITKYGIDGFRIDTAKHTDDKFFPRWIPKLLAIAKKAQKTDFTMYGEAWLPERADLVSYAITSRLQSLLDFPSQVAFTQFAGGKTSGSSLISAFKYDDFYNLGGTRDGVIRNAYNLTTFLGNHDMGRGNSQIDGSTSATGPELLQRVNLGNSLLFLMRGTPTVYYGDELGMKSPNGDQQARQDMMPTQVPAWQTASRIGSDPIGTASGLNPALLSNPIATHITSLQTLRATHPALVNGAFIPRQSNGKIASFSRIQPGDNHEYVVAVNGDDVDGTITVNTSTPSTVFNGIFGTAATANADDAGAMTITVPARSAVVFLSANALPTTTKAPTVTLKVKPDYFFMLPVASATVSATTDMVSVTWVARTSATGAWYRLGTDDTASFRLPLLADAWRGKPSIQMAAIVRTSDGKTSGSTIMTVVRSAVTPKQ